MTITLDAIKAEQTRLAEMIATFEAKANELRFVDIIARRIVLSPGEQYAGRITAHGSEPGYHLILLPNEGSDLTWQGAQEWAARQGGDLPTRREQALLYANLKDQFQSACYWSKEQHASASAYAWFQGFDYGSQSYDHKHGKLRARAVRRLAL